MIEVFKSIGKRKTFYALIALQFIVSLVFFFISLAALQSAFYINIMVPRELKVEPERIVHLSVQYKTNKADFYEFIDEISKNVIDSVGTYRAGGIRADRLGGEIAATYIDKGIKEAKEIKVIKGTYFEENDYIYDELMNSAEKTLSVLVGYDLAEQYGIEVGDVFCDNWDTYYSVKGILESGSTWFFQSMSEGMIMELDNQIVLPKAEGVMTELNYYCVLSEEMANQDVIDIIEQYAKKYELVLEAATIGNELEESFEQSYKENIAWITFVTVMSLMIGIGTTILFVAQLNSRKKSIGIRLSVGYSPKKIMRLILGEVFILAFVSYVVAVCAGKLMLGNESVYFSGMSYSYGYYVSDEIILCGAVLMFIMCMPAIITLGVKIKRLQPRELIGGNE